MASIALTLRNAILAELVSTSTVTAAYKGPRDKPCTTFPWAEVILGNAPVTRMLYGPQRYDRELSIIIHAKTEESCMLTLEALSVLYEGSSATWRTLKAISIGAGNELLDLHPVEGAGSYNYDGANNEHIGIAEFTLSYRKAVS